MREAEERNGSINNTNTRRGERERGREKGENLPQQILVKLVDVQCGEKILTSIKKTNRKTCPALQEKVIPHPLQIPE